MDYYAMAEELMDLRFETLEMRANRQLAKLETGELFVMNYLSEHGCTAYPKELSRAMSVSTARIAVILKRLEKNKWITRKSDMADNRQVIVSLTSSGYTMIREKRKELLSLWAEILEEIGPDDAREFLRVKRRIAECDANK